MENGGRAKSTGRILLVHGALYFCLGAGAWLLDAVLGFPGLGYRWFSLGSRALDLPLSICVGVAMGCAAMVTIWVYPAVLGTSTARPDLVDTAYYPRPRRLSEVRTNRLSVLLMIAVFLPLFFLWAFRVSLYLWIAFHPDEYSLQMGQLVTRFPFLAISLLVMWGTLWLADVLTRPSRHTLPVCVAYWIWMSVLAALFASVPPIVE